MINPVAPPSEGGEMAAEQKEGGRRGGGWAESVPLATVLAVVVAVGSSIAVNSYGLRAIEKSIGESERRLSGALGEIKSQIRTLEDRASARTATLAEHRAEMAALNRRVETVERALQSQIDWNGTMNQKLAVLVDRLEGARP